MFHLHRRPATLSSVDEPRWGIESFAPSPISERHYAAAVVAEGKDWTAHYFEWKNRMEKRKSRIEINRPTQVIRPIGNGTGRRKRRAMQGSGLGFEERQTLLIFSFRSIACGLASGTFRKIHVLSSLV